MSNIAKGERRVVVTGLCLITALGLDLEKIWNGLINGKSGVTPVERIDVSKIACRIAAQIYDFEPKEYIDFKTARRMDRFAQFAVKSSNDTIADSGLIIDEKNAHRVGAIVGSGVGGLSALEEQHIRLIEKGADKVSPFVIPMMIVNATNVKRRAPETR